MTQTIALIDYGAGNLRSMANALERAASDAGLEVRVLVTADPDRVRRADRIVLPGVGAFGACRAGLYGARGLVEGLEEAVRRGGRPFLGVCVGMQLLAEAGYEHGEHAGLGWIGGAVTPLRPQSDNTAHLQTGLKMPHMGWNAVSAGPARSGHAVFEAIAPGAEVYFVHSYALEATRPQEVALVCNYGGAFTAAVAQDTVIGVQFHPEKSQSVGLGLLAAFLTWRP